MVVLLSFNSKWYFKCFVSPSAGNIYDNDECSDTSLPRIFIWKENTKYEELINESYIVKCKISTHTMIKMNVLRMMALYMDHVICLLSLKEAGAFLTVKHRYTPNKSMSTSTEKENKMFNKKRSLIHRKCKFHWQESNSFSYFHKQNMTTSFLCTWWILTRHWFPASASCFDWLTTKPLNRPPWWPLLEQIVESVSCLAAEFV